MENFFFFQRVTAVPMQGPLPYEAAYATKHGKTVVANRDLDKVCKRRADCLYPEYHAFQGPAFTVHETLEGAEALLGWCARINGGVSEPVPVWQCTDTGRFQIGY
jgi:hypothetical protein